MAVERRGEDERDELVHCRKALDDGLRGRAAKKKGGRMDGCREGQIC